MRKNGSRLISLQQYRLTDLVIFAVIMVIYDLLIKFVPQLFAKDANFGFSLTLMFTVLIMFRWGWFSAFFAVADGVILSALFGQGMWQSYLCYIVANAAMMLLLIIVKFAGVKKITSKWYFTVLFIIAGWVTQNLVLTVMQVIFGVSFVDALTGSVGFSLTGFLALAMAIIIILALRRFDGMCEDQREYIKRVRGEVERKNRISDYGEQLEELDEEALSILHKHDDDLY